MGKLYEDSDRLDQTKLESIGPFRMAMACYGVEMRLFLISSLLLVGCSQPNQKRADTKPLGDVCEKRHAQSAQSLVERHIYEKDLLVRIDFDEGSNGVVDQIRTYSYSNGVLESVETTRGDRLIERRLMTFENGRKVQELVDDVDATGARGVDGESDKTVTYTYTDGRLSEISTQSEWSKPLRRVHHYSGENLERIDVIQDDVLIARHVHQYAGNRWVGTDVDFGPNDEIDEKYRFTYDDADRITSVKKYRGEDVFHTVDHRYDCAH